MFSSTMMLTSWLNVPHVESHVISDCASLVDHMFSFDPNVTEKRLKIDLVGMKENLDNGGEAIDTRYVQTFDRIVVSFCFMIQVRPGF